MGWFDSDSDDEGTTKRKPKALPSLESLMSPAEEEEPKKSDDAKEDGANDDPLEQFMATLATGQKETAHKNGVASGKERLDLELEEDERSDEGCLEQTTQVTQQAKSHEQATTPFNKVFWSKRDTAMGRQWREQNNIHCSVPIDPILEFGEMRTLFGDPLLETIQRQGYQHPTLVQSQTMPVAMSGCDVLVTAQTGQGKTNAYLWPLIVHILDQPHLEASQTGPIALVLVPTRELALQVHSQAKTMLKSSGGTAKAVIGGQGKYLLQQELKKNGGVELVVATPGRLLDVLSDKKGLSLVRVTAVVLDECDKMLNMGFEKQVTQILSAVRKDRHTLMLSATLGRKLEQVAAEWLNDGYARVKVGTAGESSQNVEQHVIVLQNGKMKERFLMELLPTLQAVGRTLVFVATKESCDRLASCIEKELPEVTVAALHGDKHQSDRSTALRSFSRGQVSTLVATDLAGRGLDVPNVATVVNFDPAKNLDTHVHRIGRTGRLSRDEQKRGTAYTLLTPKNADFAHVLKGSFEREHRPVSQELQELANNSKKAGNVARRRHSDRDQHLHGGSYNDSSPNKRSRLTTNPQI